MAAAVVVAAVIVAAVTVAAATTFIVVAATTADVAKGGEKLSNIRKNMGLTKKNRVSFKLAWGALRK